MARRRMFSLDVIDTDSFLEMPASTQALYFHLGMRADDDGFVSSPKRITAMVNCADDDLRLLITKRFILAVKEGIVIITHWRMNNYIRTDRYVETRYLHEKSMLRLTESNEYYVIDVPDTEGVLQTEDSGIPAVYQMTTNGTPAVDQTVDKLATQVRLGKDSIDKDSIDKSSIEKERKEKGEREGRRESPPATLKGPSDRTDISTDKHPVSHNHIHDVYMQAKEGGAVCIGEKETVKVLEVYFEAYQAHMKNPHPDLRGVHLHYIISNLAFCTDSTGNRIELEAEDYPPMIEKHFDTVYDSCDYNIAHFMSGAVRANRYYETCFVQESGGERRVHPMC